MISGVDEIRQPYLARLADMQLQYLPDSLVSMFGRQYAQSFYRYVARSSRELLVVLKDGDLIAAGCVLSLTPDTLSRRLVFGTPFVLWAPVGAARIVVRRLSGASDQSGVSAEHVASGSRAGFDLELRASPEVIYIFVDSGSRNRGLGSNLLISCENYLSEHGFDRYIVNTWGDNANPTPRFYLRNGFATCGRSVVRGVPMQTMEKILVARPNDQKQ